MPFDFSPNLTLRKVLRRRETLVLDDAAGTVIAVDRGCLWVTLESDPRDVVLLPGMRFEIDRDGRTVVAAEEDSRLRLIARESAARRVAAWASRAAARAVRRWSGLLRRQSVPYY
ncbi:MAG TPA: DUF2917 domain-containing protein [Casimicrobiaceae bacterium]|nr:DUF2917 domain-containing protein [Casimicrobiaceae bacterium]